MMAVALVLVALVSGSFGLKRLMATPVDFSFDAYEGDGSAARVEDAKGDLEKHVALGSTLEDYARFFDRLGGGCWRVEDQARSPSQIICSYGHGFIIRGEWRYLIDVDATTQRSTHAVLNFGLDGL